MNGPQQNPQHQGQPHGGGHHRRRRRGRGGHGHGGQHGGQHGQHHGGPRRDHQAQPPKRTDAEVEFLNKTPVTPHEWIQFEKGSSEPTMRALDLLAPVGKGTRGLIVSPPKVGKTTYLKHICQAVAKAEPEMKTLLLLVDERPEEVTDFRRSVPAEIFSSTSDQGFESHIRAAENVYHQAVAAAAAGKDVMIVLDSLTRLARAYNTAQSGSRTLSGGLDSRAMETPRRFFGAARKLEEGGSITILATILVDTNSRMDEVIFQEFKGTGNMELVLSRPAAEGRIFPAIHVKNSGTRREELLFPPKMLETIWGLRRKLAVMSDLEATKTVVELMKRNPTNERLLETIQGAL
ncbi:MAG: transcription termination factor Rho [Elusimicrobia bacterium]|nr:transcription termination factor Rho [Elusimicrobiota bacterium]